MKKRFLVAAVIFTLMLSMVPTITLAVGSGAPNPAIAKAIQDEYNYQKNELGFNPGNPFGDGKVMTWNDGGVSAICQWFSNGDSTAIVFSTQGPWYRMMGGMMGAFEVPNLTVIFPVSDGQGGYKAYTVKNEIQNTVWWPHYNPDVSGGLSSLGAPASNEFWTVDQNGNDFLAQNFQLGAVYVYYDENGNNIRSDKVRGLTFVPNQVNNTPPDPNEGQDDEQEIPDPVLWYKFDETSGSSAVDSSGNGKNGTLVNSPTWVAGKIDNAVKLNGGSSGQHIKLPNDIMSNINKFTIASWVKMGDGTEWTRIFDFGSGETAPIKHMYMVNTDQNGCFRFSITLNGNDGEQHVHGYMGSNLPVGEWVHVAISVDGNVGSLYINGERVGQNLYMTLKPSDLGSTTQNYIGRSQYAHDSYLNAQLDDFQIFDTALNRWAIRALGGFEGYIPPPPTPEAAEAAVESYEAAPITTLAQISLAETKGVQATSLVSKLEDGEFKTELQARIAAKKALVDEAKEALGGSVLYGDVNGDGQVTNVDLVLLKRYIAGITVDNLDGEAADVNGDGQVTNVDLILLNRYLAGVIDTLGPQ